MAGSGLKQGSLRQWMASHILTNPRPKPSHKKCTNLPNFRIKESSKSRGTSTSLGSKEHGGRIRDLSFKLTFRDGFQEDQSTYNSHDRYKEDMIQAAEKSAESKFKEMLAQMVEQ